MIIGEYRQTIGDKNRIAFPKVFRNEMGNLLIVTKGYEGCLAIMTPAQWKELVTDVVSGPFVSSLIRDTSRFLLASASEINLDAQGRFVIPPYLVEYAKLKNEGVFLGLGNWVELWEKSLWKEKKKELSDMSSITGEKLAGLRLSNNNDKT